MAFNPRQLMQMIANQQKNDEGLIHFRAGRLFMNESTKMVTADNRRGKVKIVKDDTGMMKFQWINRVSGQTDLDLMVMPRSARWEKVDECQDGRVYLLRLTDSNRKHFFWMQEPDEEKDVEYFTKINKLCNGESLSDDKNKGDASSAASSGANAAFGAQNQGGMGQNAMAQLLLNAIQGNNTGAFGAANNQGAASNSNSNTSNAGGQAAQAQMMEEMMRQQMQQRVEEMKREPDLEDILDASNAQVVALLDDEKVVEELAQHLPESMRTREAMLEQLQSPQFQGALRRLQSVLNGPQMPTILSQMGIQNSNQNAMGVTAFADAIQAKSGGDGKAQDDDGDSAMKDDKDKDKTKEQDKDKDKSNDPDMYK